MTFVERDHARAAEPEIVLQGKTRAFDLAFPSLAAQLPQQFDALG